MSDSSLIGPAFPLIVAIKTKMAPRCATLLRAASGTNAAMCHFTLLGGLAYGWSMTDGAERGNQDNLVTREDGYRAFAARTLELASRTSNLKDKSHLLAMAEAWLNLADRINRLEKRPQVKIPEHPAVKQTFGTARREAD